MKLYDFTLKTDTLLIDGCMPAESNHEVLKVVKMLIDSDSTKAKISIRKVK